MIRVPLLDVRAPWIVLLSAAVATALMLAVGGAGLALSPSWPARAWSRLRRAIAVAVTIVAVLMLAGRRLILRPPPWLRAWRTRRRVERTLRDADWWQQAAGLWTVTEQRQFHALLSRNDKRAGRP